MSVSGVDKAPPPQTPPRVGPTDEQITKICCKIFGIRLVLTEGTILVPF